jgi:membrane protein YdbS with pleckstrin-like domain
MFRLKKQVFASKTWYNFDITQNMEVDMTADNDSGEKPLFTIKPRYYFSVILPRSIPVMMFIFLFIGALCFIGSIFFGMAIPSIFDFDGLEEGVVMVVGLVIGLIATFFSCLGYHFMLAQTYKRSEYRFFSDRTEFYEGFFTIMKKSIEYTKILEVSMTSGVLQQQKNLGSFTLLTAATTVDRPSGLKIPDIENPDENYKKIKQIVQKK